MNSVNCAKKPYEKEKNKKSPDTAPLYVVLCACSAGAVHGSFSNKALSQK